jgi:hypothetical protein
MDLATARRSVRERSRQSRTSDRDAFPLQGGTNLIDPPTEIAPGYCLAAENYEMGVAGGYERIGGFERFDGHPAPSAAPYYILAFRNRIAFTPYMAYGSGYIVVDTNPLLGTGTILSAPVQVAPIGRNCAEQTENLNQGNWVVGNATLSSVTTDMPQAPGYAVLLRGYAGGASPSDSAPVVPRQAWQLVEQATNASHDISASWAFGLGASVASGNYLLCSVFMKRRSGSDARYARIVSSSVTSFANAVAPQAIYDLQTGSVMSTTGSVLSAYTQYYGNGWYRCVMLTQPLTSSMLTSLLLTIGIVADDFTNVSYAGNTARGIYVTGLNTDIGTTQPNFTAYRHATANGALPVDAGVAYIPLSSTAHPFVSAVTGGSQGTLIDSNGTTVGTWSGDVMESAARTIGEHLTLKSAAANEARRLINKIPGSGPIRGVWLYNNIVFAFRDNAAGTATDMWKVSLGGGTGFSLMAFSYHIDFDTGLAAGSSIVVEGATLTGNTSGATATIARVNLTSSNWAGNVAKGRLVLSGVVGTFQNGESLKIGATAVATARSANFRPTLSPAGTYRFRTYNFYGAANKLRMYGVNGIDPFFEYESGTDTLAQYKTGMTVDSPSHIACHQYMLFLGFAGGSLQNSGVGFPATWTVTSGASEIAVGDYITELLEEVADTLFIFTRNQTYQLQGTSVSNFLLKRFDPRNGSIAKTVQRLGFGIHLDDRGFSSLTASQVFGNYESNTFSHLIQPLIVSFLAASDVTASVIHRAGNRYRCFFDNKSFISIGTSSSKITGHMVCNYGLVVRAICSEEDGAGNERIFFGSDDGYIYEAEVGTSFDGNPITASLRLAYHHSGYPNRTKRYRAGRVEANLDGQCSLTVQPDLSFGKTVLSDRNISASVGGAIWDYTMRFEAFNWDNEVEPLSSFTIGADGINIGLLFKHTSTLENKHTLRAVTYQTTMRGISRGTDVG